MPIGNISGYNIPISGTLRSEGPAMLNGNVIWYQHTQWWSIANLCFHGWNHTTVIAKQNATLIQSSAGRNAMTAITGKDLGKKAYGNIPCMLSLNLGLPVSGCLPVWLPNCYWWSHQVNRAPQICYKMLTFLCTCNMHYWLCKRRFCIEFYFYFIQMHRYSFLRFNSLKITCQPWNLRKRDKWEENSLK